jgi:hypothetical protein
MKKAPTLADACIASGLYTKRMLGNPEAANLYLQVAQARKFVLDERMSEFLFDLSQNFWKVGGLRQRLTALENSRRLARLPHAMTWVELDYNAYMQRTAHHGMTIKRIGKIDDSAPPGRVGLLVRQHPQIETAFITSEFTDSVMKPGFALTHPVSMVWRSDDDPLPWRTMKIWKDEPDAELLVMMKGYNSKQCGWAYTYSEKFSAGMMQTISSAAGPELLKPKISIRDIWALFATINDLPVIMENVEPSRGYISKGSYKKFLKHSVVHLNVPETRWRKLIAKAATILRRRAHQVRGHWRKDWRNPLSPLCEHIFAEDLSCTRCQGRKLWIGEHQRGDTSLGFVTHDYEVHHDDPR